ncbi:hypothetical protein ACW0JT_02250 [Arthrobacter sp. SA17]
MDAGLFSGGMVSVEGTLLRDLAGRYGQYRHALAGPFDPVKILALTGDVLQSVSIILSAIEQPSGQHPVDPGKAQQ